MTYMPPLPGITPLPEDRLRRWLSNETLSFNKILTGELQAGEELTSVGYVAGTTGWKIDGAGDAEFNDVTIRGDILSGNWDGADPVNLASEDGTATEGFALDSSAGAAQFEGNIWVGGTLTVGGSVTISGSATISGNATISGTATLSGTLDMDGTGAFQTDSTGPRIVMGVGGHDYIQFYTTNSDDTGADPGYITPSSSGDPGIEGLVLRSPFQTADTYSEIGLGSEHGSGASSGYPYIAINRGSAADLVSIVFTGDDHSTSTAAAIGRRNNRQDGIFWNSSGHTVIMRNGVVKANLGTDTRIDGINDTTTAAAANVFVNSTTGLMARSTSSLKYKKDWQFADMDALADLALPTPIVWTETRVEKKIEFAKKSDSIPERVFQDIYLGFGTEHVEKMLPAAVQDRNEKGEPDNYDPRALIAVLVAKIARLERLAGVSA